MGAINEWAVDGEAFPQAPTYINSVTLSAGVAQSITIPSGAQGVAFGRTGNFYARFDGGTAAVPSAAVINGGGSEAIPKQRGIRGIQTISVIAPADCVVTAAFYFFR